MKKTKIVGVGAVVTVLVLVAAASFVDGAANTQTDPSKLRLLSQEDLHYVGGFRLPAGTVNGQDYSFGGHPVAFNPERGTLFVANRQANVAELSIPGPVNNADVKALPFATFVQPFADPTEGRLAEISGIGVSLSGLMVHDNRLYGTASIYYDANNNQRFSHFVTLPPTQSTELCRLVAGLGDQQNGVCRRNDGRDSGGVAHAVGWCGADGPVLHSDRVAHVERAGGVRIRSGQDRSTERERNPTPLLHARARDAWRVGGFESDLRRGHWRRRSGGDCRYTHRLVFRT